MALTPQPNNKNTITFKEATLSPAVQRHLDEAHAKDNRELFEIIYTKKVEGEEDTASRDDKFTLFPKLTIELRTKIWKHCIENIENRTQQQTVELIIGKNGFRTVGNGSLVALMQVNREVKSEVLGVGGYIAFDLKFLEEKGSEDQTAAMRTTKTKNAQDKELTTESANIQTMLVIHPENQILYIRHEPQVPPPGLKKFKHFIKSFPRDKIKCIGIEWGTPPGVRTTMLESMAAFDSLELVFIVYDPPDPGPAPSETYGFNILKAKDRIVNGVMTPTFLLRSSRAILTRSEHLVYFLPHMLPIGVQGSGGEWQRIMVRGNGIMPQIVFSGKVWKLTEAEYNGRIAGEKRLADNRAHERRWQRELAGLQIH